jgi:putative restriction endonuclease
MANAVFTTKVQPVYDDLPEWKYHFPKTYLNQASQAVGDLILYYEPRREGADLAGRSGRQVYFATARVDRIEEDTALSGHYYAYVSEYLEFPSPVPFRIGAHYFESALKKEDGSTNRGAFGRSVRIIPPHEFKEIWNAAFVETTIGGSETRIKEDPAPYGRSPQKVISERPFRDAAFTRVIQSRYDGKCAMTGLHLRNENGHHEIEAAHILPVAMNGPDSPRNGIALSRTIHWMFDAGMLSISESGGILCAERIVPDKIKGVLNHDRRLLLPSDPMLQPHPEFLRYHRETVYKGN